MVNVVVLKQDKNEGEKVFSNRIHKENQNKQSLSDTCSSGVTKYKTETETETWTEVEDKSENENKGENKNRLPNFHLHQKEI